MLFHFSCFSCQNKFPCDFDLWTHAFKTHLLLSISGISPQSTSLTSSTVLHKPLKQWWIMRLEWCTLTPCLPLLSRVSLQQKKPSGNSHKLCPNCEGAELVQAPYGVRTRSRCPVWSFYTSPCKQKMKRTTTQALVISLNCCVVHFLCYCTTRLQIMLTLFKLRFSSVRKSLCV